MLTSPTGGLENAIQNRAPPWSLPTLVPNGIESHGHTHRAEGMVTAETRRRGGGVLASVYRLRQDK